MIASRASTIVLPKLERSEDADLVVMSGDPFSEVYFGFNYGNSMIAVPFHTSAHLKNPLGASFLPRRFLSGAALAVKI